MNKLKEIFAIEIFRKHHLLFLLSIACAAGLMMAGTMKIRGSWMMAMFFQEKFGLPLWFMFFVGYTEFFGALSLFLKRWALYGSLALLVILIGACTFHVVSNDPWEFSKMAFALTGGMLMIFLYHWANRSAAFAATKPS